MKIAAYTVITGLDKPYDKNFEQNNKIKNENIDYFLFTNNTNIKSKFYKVVYVENNENLNCKDLSRHIKIMSHLYLKDYDATIYYDGNVCILKDIKKLVDKFIDYELSLFILGKNNNFKKEYEYIKQNVKSCIPNAKKIKESEIYKDYYDCPRYYGKIIIRQNNDTVKEFNELWFQEYMKLGRDQMSIPYCIDKSHIKFKNMGCKLGDESYFLEFFKLTNTHIKK